MNNILYSEIKRIAPNPATFVIQMCVGGWRDGSRLTSDNDYFTVGRCYDYSYGEILHPIIFVE